jgi:hypothetical protein
MFSMLLCTLLLNPAVEPPEARNTLDKTTAHPQPPDWLHVSEGVFGQLLCHYASLGKMNTNHERQKVPSNLQNKVCQCWDMDEHIVIQQRARGKVCFAGKQQIDQQTLAEVDEVAEFGVGRHILGDEYTTVAQDMQAVFVHLNKTLACLAKGLERGVEGNDGSLTATAKAHLDQVDVCHLGLAALPSSLGSVDFEIATDLDLGVR